MKLQKFVYSIVNTVIRVLLILIISGMCLQSMFSTSFIGYITQEDGFRQERTLNIADQPWKHLIVFAVFTAVCILLYRRCRLWDKHRRAFLCLNVVIFLIGTLWVLITQLQPGSDPAKVYKIAMQWREGNFSSYAEGGYLFRYPYQSGIILFYYFLSFLFGINNYVGLQFVNVIALAAVYMLLVRLSSVFWQEKLSVIVHAALILWLPITFYVTYLYGTLPGMALSLGAVYCAVQYLNTRKYRYILPSALCMGLATVLKMNCLIFLIAIACFLFYDAIDILPPKKKELHGQWIVSLAFIGLLILGVVGCNGASDRYVERLSGYRAGDGEAMISWVVMGLQETPLGPGGYSGYIGDIFVEKHYDTEKINEASIAEIKGIIEKMAKDPLHDAIPFFARKNAFQWNDPTFISLDRTRGRTSAVEMPGFAVSLIEGKGSTAFSILMNYMQTLILLGVLLYLIINRRGSNIYELMSGVIFLGGYLFHFVWESSASYTIPYFVIIIPYAVKGFADWSRCVDGVIVSVRENKENKAAVYDVIRKTYKPAACALVVLVVIALLSGRNIFRNTIALNDGDDAEAQFYHRTESETAETASGMAASAAKDWGGYCYLSPFGVPDKAVVPLNGEMTLVSIDPSASKADNTTSKEYTLTKLADVKDIENKVLIRQDGSGVCIRFRSNEQVLAVDESGEYPQLTTYLDDGMNMFYEPRSDMSYRWEMSPTADSGYYITMGEMALTCRDGALTMEVMAESDEQRWVLRP